MANSRDLANFGDTLNGVSNVNIDSGTLFVDAANNFVGIGTTSPTKKLVISDSNNFGLEFSPNDAAQSYNRVISYNRTTNLYVPVRYEGSTHSWYANTNGTLNVMSIDTSGRVLKPYQPAFHAYHSSVSILNISGSANGDEVFNTTAVNIGSGYSTGTGRYTAPVAGTYLFYGSIAYNAITTGSYTGSVIKRNGSMITEGYSTAATMGYSHPMVMVIATMAVNDYVTLGYNYSVGSGTIERSAPGRMFFGGYLLG